MLWELECKYLKYFVNLLLLLCQMLSISVIFYFSENSRSSAAIRGKHQNCTGQTTENNAEKEIVTCSQERDKKC